MIAAYAAFLLSAIALLGSPGPGIAALVAVGRADGLQGGLRFYGGMQIGLAAAAILCGIGLFSALAAIPGALTVMTVGGVAYLLYLAWQIASAPVGVAAEEVQVTASAAGGFVLGAFNPKAYLALGALMAAHTLIPGNVVLDAATKTALCIAVMVIVDLAWLAAGAGLKTVRLAPARERMVNLLLGASVAAAALAAMI